MKVGSHYLFVIEYLTFKYSYGYLQVDKLPSLHPPYLIPHPRKLLLQSH